MKKEEGRRKKKEGIRKKEEGRRKKEEARRKKEEGRRKKEEGRRKKEEGRRKKEEGRRKKEEGRRKKEEGRRKKEEGRRKKRKKTVNIRLCCKLTLSFPTLTTHRSENVWRPPVAVGKNSKILRRGTFIIWTFPLGTANGKDPRKWMPPPKKVRDCDRKIKTSLNSKHISCCLNGILPFLPPHFFSPCSVHPFTHAPTVQAVTCAICLDICIDPTSCKNGHLYCLDCLRSHLTVSQYRSCPTCRIR